MPVKQDAWDEGTPAWVDLMASDFEAVKNFYGSLFGWEFSESSEEFGHYSVATLGGEAVAGIGPAQSFSGSPPGEGFEGSPLAEGFEGLSPAWTTYVAVDDAEAAAARVTEAGGSVLAPPMAVGDFGTMALAVDPTGTFFGLWQSGTHTGVNRYNEPGALTWNEAMVGDYQAGKDFYSAVFGYTYSEIGNDQMAYSTIELDGRTVGGMGAATMIGEGVPPHWRTYFSVEDMDATIAKVTELGGAVVTEPFDTPFGKMAAVSGVGGEVFLLNEAPSAEDASTTR